MTSAIIKLTQSDMLSENSEVLTDDMILTLITDRLNLFLLEAYEIKKNMTDPKNKLEYMKKFKLLMDCITIYQNENLIKNVLEYLKERDKPKPLIETKPLQSYGMGYNGWNGDENLFDLFKTDIKPNIGKNDDEEDDVNSDFDFDDFHADKYEQFIDNSMLKLTEKGNFSEIFKISRKYTTKLVDSKSVSANNSTDEAHEDTNESYDVNIDNYDTDIPPEQFETI